MALVSIVAELLVDGVIAGAIYATLAIGLNIVFGVTKVLNFAQGEFMMLGMYATFFLITLTNIPFFLAIIPVFALFFAGGTVIDRFLIRSVRAQGEISQIVVMVALSTFLVNVAAYAFSPNFQAVPGASVAFASISVGFSVIKVTLSQLLLLAYVIVALLGSEYLVMRTKLGLAMRAVSQDKELASAFGVNDERVYMFAFSFSMALTAVGGLMIIPFSPVYPSVGSTFFLIALVVIILGGLGSALGAFIGAMILGIVESFGTFYLGGLSYLTVYAVFVAVLVLRPEGLLGRRTRV